MTGNSDGSFNEADMDYRERGIHRQYDWAETPPSMAVVEAVAGADGRDMTAIDPLYEYFDPDALNAIVRSNGGKTADGDVTVSFRFQGYQVTVDDHGGVMVRAGAAEA